MTKGDAGPGGRGFSSQARKGCGRIVFAALFVLLELFLLARFGAAGAMAAFVIAATVFLFLHKVYDF
ncbi:MAG TPA: hypothetical protein VIG32_07975 [Candidatus Baltobacteraceae bacterium]